MTLDQFIAVVARVSAAIGHPISEDEVRPLIDTERVKAALDAPDACIKGKPLYPDPIQQAAILAAGISRSGPLPNGLERLTALISAEIELARAGLELNAPTEELDLVFRSVAEKQTPDGAFIRWFELRVRPSRTLS